MDPVYRSPTQLPERTEGTSPNFEPNITDPPRAGMYFAIQEYARPGLIIHERGGMDLPAITECRENKPRRYILF